MVAEREPVERKPTIKRAVSALGDLMRTVRTKHEVSKHAIEQETTSRARAGLNHTIPYRLESGERYTLGYETLWRFIEGVNGRSERGMLGPLESRDLFSAAFQARLTYETAKFITYYLYLSHFDPLRPEQLPHALREMRAAMLADGVIGEHVGRGTRPRAKAETLSEATGFNAVRLMAEIEEGHAYRLDLLRAHFTGLHADFIERTVQIIPAA